MPSDVADQKSRARQLHLDRAEHNVAVLARLSYRVSVLKDSDPDMYEAARDTYQDAVAQLHRQPAGADALALAGYLIGQIAAGNYPTITPPEGL
jgi:hypothetical protein